MFAVVILVAVGILCFTTEVVWPEQAAADV